MTCSPLHSSDFVVVSMIFSPFTHSPLPSTTSESNCINNVNNNNNLGVVTQCSSMFFGPSDLCVLRQFLLNYKGSLSISCICTTLSISRNDWIVFSQLRWKIRTSILNLQDEGREEEALNKSLEIIENSKLALFEFISTSERDFISSRWQLITLIYSLSKKLNSIQLLSSALSLLTSSSNRNLISNSFITIVSLTIQPSSNLFRYLNINNSHIETGENFKCYSLYLCSIKEFYLLTKWFLFYSLNDEYEQLILQRDKFNFEIENFPSNYLSQLITSTPKLEKQIKKQLKKINKKVFN